MNFVDLDSFIVYAQVRLHLKDGLVAFVMHQLK